MRRLLLCAVTPYCLLACLDDLVDGLNAGHSCGRRGLTATRCRLAVGCVGALFAPDCLLACLNDFVDGVHGVYVLGRSLYEKTIDCCYEREREYTIYRV